MTRYIMAVIAFIVLAPCVRAVPAVNYLQGDARLDISYDERGSRRAAIAFKVEISNVEAFTVGFAEWFGVEASRVEAVENFEGFTLVVGARGKLVRQSPLVYSDTLNTQALQRALQAAGVETLQVVAFIPPSPIARISELQGINLLGVLRHEVTVPVESLNGDWPVRFGWRYRDLAIYIATPVVLLALFEFALRYLRRRALATQGHDQPAAIFMCGRAHHLASLLFLVLWPGVILMLVPVSYLMYLPQGYETLGFLLVVFVPFSIAVAYTIWMRAALYPVFRQFPEPNWSRGELIAQGCAISLFCLTQLPIFGGSILMRNLDRFDNTETYLLALPIVIVFILILGIHLYSRFLGTVVRTPETQYEAKRCEELAKWHGLKDAPPLALVYRLRSRLAIAIEPFISTNAIRTKQRSVIHMEARLSREATPDELDVLLLTELDKLQQTHWKWVAMVRVAYRSLIFPGLLFAFLCACLLLNESTAIKYFYNGWFLFGAIFILPSVILLAGRVHEMKLVRRYTHMTDERVMEKLGDPEAHIRALLRQARVNCVPLETPRWLRSLAAPSPMDRVRHLAERGGLSEERVAALREHIDATTDQATADTDANLLADFDRLLIRIHLFRALPMLGYIVSPLFIAWAYSKVLHEHVPFLAFLPMAVTFCALVVLGGQNVACRLGKRRLVEALQERIPLPDLAEVEAVPVRFSRVLRLGDTRVGAAHGAGLLYLVGDTLCYRSDDTELALQASRIERISVEIEPGSFFPVFGLQVDCRDGDTGALKAYRIQLLNPGAAHAVNLDTLGEYARIGRWWREETGKLAPPKDGHAANGTYPVAARVPVLDATKCTGTVLFAGILSAAMAFYIGWKEELPMSWSASNSAFLAPALFLATTAVIVVFQRVYLRRVLRQFRDCLDARLRAEAGK